MVSRYPRSHSTRVTSTALQCAELALTLDGPLPSVDKFARNPKSTRGRVKAAGPDPATSLLVHRLPPGSTAETVRQLFVEATEINPATVTEVAQSRTADPTSTEKYQSDASHIRELPFAPIGRIW